MSRSILERLRDARLFAHAGEFRVLGLDSSTFSDVVEVKYTVYYSLIGLGEALKPVSLEILLSEPSSPWEAIIGLRNRLVHTYWRIDDELVYEVATNELPALRVVIERIIKQLEEA